MRSPMISRSRSYALRLSSLLIVETIYAASFADDKPIALGLCHISLLLLT